MGGLFRQMLVKITRIKALYKPYMENRTLYHEILTNYLFKNTFRDVANRLESFNDTTTQG